MKLNYKRTLLVGLAFLSISAFWQLYDFTIPLILRNQFQISDTAAGVVMSLDNIVALFLLPVFGTLSDKVRTRLRWQSIRWCCLWLPLAWCCCSCPLTARRRWPLCRT